MAPPIKRRKVEPVEEIEFDFAAREEYLTGFHKRKLQRAKHAQEEAVKKERVQKIEVRKQLRDQRKQELESHVATVNAMLKKAQQGPSDEEESDVEGDEVEDNAVQNQEEQTEQEQEYVDEDKYTTVTIEPMKLSSDDEEDDAADGEDEAQEQEDDPTTTSKTATTRPRVVDKDGKQKRVWTKERPDNGKAKKKKKKKFRYESKVERKANRAHQKAKNSAAAKARREASEK